MNSLLVAALLILPNQNLPFGMAPCSREDVVRFVEEDFREVEPFHYVWNDLGSLMLHLTRDGGEVPSLNAVREAMEDYLSRPDAIDPQLVTQRGGLNPLILSPMVQLGLMPEDYAGEGLEKCEQKLFHFTKRHIGNVAHLIVPLETVMGARELTEEEVDYLVGRLFEELPEETGSALEELVDLIWILERIGRAEDVERLAPLAERALLVTWTGRRDGRACFAPFASLVGEPTDPLTSVWMKSTSQAVELMARFGVPDEIDLEALGRYLDDERLYYVSAKPQGGDLVAAAALSRLETFPGWVPIERSDSSDFTSTLKRLVWAGAGSMLVLVLLGVFVFFAASRRSANKSSDWSSSEPA